MKSRLNQNEKSDRDLFLSPRFYDGSTAAFRFLAAAGFGNEVTVDILPDCSEIPEMLAVLSLAGVKRILVRKDAIAQAETLRRYGCSPAGNRPEGELLSIV